MNKQQLVALARETFLEVVDGEDFQREFPTMTAEQRQAHAEWLSHTITRREARELGIV